MTVPRLSRAGRALLKKAVQLSSAGFKQIADVSPRGVAALHVFLSSPAVRRAKSVWNAVFGAQPPRGAIARVARLVGATLPDAVGYFNYPSRKGFVAEVKRMRRWYKVGRRLTRRHRVLRGPAGTEVRGRKTVWNGKLTTHYRRLLGKVRMRGLWRWRRCALALHRAGVAVHSGTVPVERHWMQYSSYWPPEVRNITEKPFALLSDMCFLRFNWTHFNKPWVAKWTRGDSLLMQRAAETLAALRAAEMGDTVPIQAELEADYKKRASQCPPRPIRKRRRIEQQPVADATVVQTLDTSADPHAHPA